MNGTSSTFYDVIILGCGPAGLQAAIHAARRKAGILILGRMESSSLFKAHVENYCCVEGVRTGEELLKIGLEQAKASGAELLREDAVSTGTNADGTFTVSVESGGTYTCYALIIATGVSRKGLGLKGEKDFVGKGVSYCVDCDANFYKDAVVVVAGDGSAAAHGAITLGRIAAKTTLISNHLAISPSLKKELDESDVAIIHGRTIKELKGSAERLNGIVLDDGTSMDIDGLFIEKGAKGVMELAAFLGVTLDPEKFTHIVTDGDQATNIPGIFAAGDICGLPYQMAKAVGEGCIAGLAAGKYVSMKKRQAKESSK